MAAAHHEQPVPPQQSWRWESLLKGNIHQKRLPSSQLLQKQIESSSPNPCDQPDLWRGVGSSWPTWPPERLHLSLPAQSRAPEHTAVPQAHHSHIGDTAATAGACFLSPPRGAHLLAHLHATLIVKGKSVCLLLSHLVAHGLIKLPEI